MSTIDQNSQNSLSAILDKLGVNRADEKKQAAQNTLGQEDFLKLMTTQLQNQDPFAPMENGDFIETCKVKLNDSAFEGFHKKHQTCPSKGKQTVSVFD